MPYLPKRYTEESIDRLKPTSKEQIYYDRALIGFGVRVRPNGRRVFLLRYRNAEGLHRKLVLGRCGVLPLEEAQDLAQETLREIRKGTDPVIAKKDRRQAPTIDDLARRYLEIHGAKLKPASRAAAGRALQRYILPVIGSKKVADVERSDIERLHYEIGQSKPVGANRILSMLSKMFNLAERWGLRPLGSNPSRFVDRYRETPRDRPVKSDELPRLLEAIEKEGDPYARSALKLYLLTGLRKRELLHARWENVDLGRGTLRLPNTKNPLPALRTVKKDSRPTGHLQLLPSAGWRLRPIVPQPLDTPPPTFLPVRPPVRPQAVRPPQRPSTCHL